MLPILIVVLLLTSVSDLSICLVRRIVGMASCQYPPHTDKPRAAIRFLGLSPRGSESAAVRQPVRRIKLSKADWNSKVSGT